MIAFKVNDCGYKLKKLEKVAETILQTYLQNSGSQEVAKKS